MGVGIIQSTEGLSGTRRHRKGEFGLSEAGAPSSPAPRRRYYWLSELWIQTELYSGLSWFFSLESADGRTSQLIHKTTIRVYSGFSRETEPIGYTHKHT